MPIDFYYLPGSAPCRAVLLTAKVLDIPLNLKLTELMKGEHLTPEFVKLNPQHTIPTINDNGFCLWERYVQKFIKVSGRAEIYCNKKMH